MEDFKLLCGILCLCFFAYFYLRWFIALFNSFDSNIAAIAVAFALFGHFLHSDDKDKKVIYEQISMYCYVICAICVVFYFLK